MTGVAACSVQLPYSTGLSASVVVPAHGRVGLLAETLASLASQRFADVELVVADDAPDPVDARKTEELVLRYRRETGRSARYLRTGVRLGISRNTNQGLAAARADVVRQLHSDDLLAPDAVARELELLERFSGDVAVVLHVPLTFSESPPSWREPTLCLVDPGLYLTQWMPFHTAVPSAIAVRRDVLDRVGHLDEKLSFLVDWDFVSHLCLHERRQGRLLAYLTEGLVGYRLHPGSVTSSGWRDHYAEHAALTRRLLRDTAGDGWLWSPGSRRRFARAAVRYRWHRLEEALGGPGLGAYIRGGLPLLTALASRDGLADLIMLRRSRRAEAEPSEPSEPSETSEGRPEAGGVVEVYPYVRLDAAAGAGTRFCVRLDEHLSLARYDAVLRAAEVVRVWHPDDRKAAVPVLRELGRRVSPGKQLQVVTRPDEWPAAKDVAAVLSRSLPGRFLPVGGSVERDGRLYVTMQARP